MCYYNGIRVTRAQLLELLKREKEIKIARLLQSGFDYSDWPIIRPIIPGKDWGIEMAHWEFIPSWIKNDNELKESRKKFTTLNATAEKLFESKMFRESALKRRCLVLTSGFYEWRHFNKKTYPYYISVASEIEEPVFFMAGIYQPWTDKVTGETFNTFAIVTTKANELMEQIHNTKKRMPTILPKPLAEEWISDIPEERIKEIAAFQYDSEEMTACTIAKDFRDSVDPMKEFFYEELEPLQ